MGAKVSTTLNTLLLHTHDAFCVWLFNKFDVNKSQFSLMDALQHVTGRVEELREALLLF